MTVYRIENDVCELEKKVQVEIEEDYITQIEASIEKDELYFIAKSKKLSTLYIHSFEDFTCKRKIKEVLGVSLSTDEMLLAYST